MKRFLLVVFLFLPCSLFAESFDVVDHEMKLGLIELQEEIDFISSAVMGCIDSGREQHDCMCANKAMFSHFSDTVATMLEKFPELENFDLVTYKDQKGLQVTQSMVGIKNQAAMQLDCGAPPK